MVFKTINANKLTFRVKVIPRIKKVGINYGQKKNNLKDLDCPWPIAEIAHQKNENIDSIGYPCILKDGNILIKVQIIRVVDVVKSMSSHCPFRPTLGIEKALEEISKNKGILYDPKIVEICISLFQGKGFNFK